MLDKARALAADEIVIDLEDSVAPAAKEEARASVVAALREAGWQAGSISVRMNATGSRWGHRDVVELLEQAGDALHCIVIPKVESAADVDFVHRLASAVEQTGVREQPVGLQALIETAAGLAQIHAIAQSCERLETLIVGYADMAASLGVPAAGEYPGDRWHAIRETVLVAARVAGLQAIDGPYLAIKDLDGLHVNATSARALGYDGKWALHPTQIEPLNAIFGPTPEELRQATEVLAALQEAERDAGRGAVMLDGAMIDEASRKLAAQIVARGRAAGLV